MTQADDPLDGASLSSEAAADVATVARGGAVQIIGQISQRGLAFLFSVVATRPSFLGIGGFGLYRFVTQVLSIAGIVGLGGFNYASMHFISAARAVKDPSGARSAGRVGLRGAVVSSAIVVAVLIVGADLLATPFSASPAKREQLAYLLRIGAAYVPLFALMQVLRYCTQAYKTMVPSVIVGNIIQPTARFLIGVGVLVAGFAVTGAVVTLSLSMGIGVLAAAYYYRRMLSVEERAADRRPVARPMIRFALPQLGASLFNVQALGLGIVVLKLFTESNVPVGLFAIALALQGPGGIFLSGIVNIWAPVVSDLYARGEIGRLESLYQTITRWVATFSFPVFGLLMLYPDVFVRIFNSRALDAAPLVVILAIGNVFYAGTGPTGYVISMTGRPGVNFINSIVAVGLYVGLAFLIVPRYGAIGMAVVDATVTALINSVRVIEAKLLVGVQPFGRSFLKPVGATLLAMGASLAWRLVPGEGVLIELPGIALAAVVYLLSLRVMGLDAEERYVWERIKGRALRRKPR
ncbi:MAG: oligosaccharide flippase family protein [Actinomycetota bacterium]|nr:oligosaccharide flippase family protein [Actinomycetota bacterium]